MPGMLIGHNTAIGPDLLAEQSQLCADYAQQLGDAPGLLYYINGDYQLILTEHPQAVQQEWRQWLRSRYASIEAWQQAWARPGLPGDFDQIEYPPLDSGRWDDVARIDDVRFRTELTARWNRAHVAAIRTLDRDHPITSEYYAQPSEGIDLPLTIDAQDVSNIGYFDPPGQDLRATAVEDQFRGPAGSWPGSQFGRVRCQDASCLAGVERRDRVSYRPHGRAAETAVHGRGPLRTGDGLLQDSELVPARRFRLGVSVGNFLSAPVGGQGRGLRAPQPIAGLAVPATAVQRPGRARVLGQPSAIGK